MTLFKNVVSNYIIMILYKKSMNNMNYKLGSIFKVYDDLVMLIKLPPNSVPGTYGFLKLSSGTLCKHLSVNVHGLINNYKSDFICESIEDIIKNKT